MAAAGSGTGTGSRPGASTEATSGTSTPKPTFSLIAALSRNRVIGVAGQLPWHIPEDLKFFKSKTKNHIIIMGRKTFESIGSKPLPSRYNIVISRAGVVSAPARMDSKDMSSAGQQSSAAKTSAPARVDSVGPNLYFCKSIEEALVHARTKVSEPGNIWGEEVFICGGGEIYNQTIAGADRIYLTWIEKEVEGDARFPEVPSTFSEVSRDSRGGDPAYAFVTYERRL